MRILTALHPATRALGAVLLAVVAALAALGTGGVARAQDQGTPHVDVVHVEGPITSVVAGYVERSIDAALEDGVDVIVIQLDTPGGAVDAAESITRRIESSPVPVVVWVGPSGAMAASAGTFIALAGHMAAMAPRTSIGAASPVDGHGFDLQETMRRKTESILVTRIRSLAAARGAHVQDWAEEAVREAVSADDIEAVEKGIVDLIAATLDDLLAQADQRAVTIHGAPVRLRTFGAEIRHVEMGPFEAVLHAVASPNLAYVLLIAGLLGLAIEIATPGIGVSGVLGAVCLLLGVYALGVLPANYAGVALIVLAFGMFFADAKLGSGGVVALGGVVAMVIGGSILFDSPGLAVSPAVLWPSAIACGAFFAFAAGAVLRSLRQRAVTGREGLVGARGVARDRLAPDGQVLVRGERWRATVVSGEVAAGEAVEVVEVAGLRLRVRAAPDAQGGT